MDALLRQLKKGVLSIVILSFLKTKKMYGYEIMLKLEESPGAFFAMKEGTLYPILYRLEDSAYIKSEWEADTEKRGVPRKYYLITASGEKYFENSKEVLKVFTKALNEIVEE